MKKLLSLALFLSILLSAAGARAGEFLNAFMHVNFGVSYGIIGGDIIDYEHNANNYVFGTTVFKAGHYDLSYGLFVDILPIPPILLGNESNALKFGIRTRFNSNNLRQTLTIRLSSSKEYNFRGDLINYTSWMVGPVVYYSPIINSDNLEETYRSSGGFTLFLLFGKIIEGRLRAYPSLRDLEVTVPIPYSTSLSGYRIDFGAGAAISFCSINVGMNIFYSMLNVTTETRVYYHLPRYQRFDEFCIEIFMGIPFEWSRIPLVF